MKNLFFFIAFFGTYQIIAQTQPVSATFFSEAGERFWVVMDGIRQNAEPQTNVEVKQLTKSYLKAKIIFEDEKIGNISQTIATLDVDGRPMNTVYVLTRRHAITGRVGKMRMRISSFDEAVPVEKPVVALPVVVPATTPAPQQPAIATPATIRDTVRMEVAVQNPLGNGQTQITNTAQETKTVEEAVFLEQRPTNQQPVKAELPTTTPACTAMDQGDFTEFLAEINKQSFDNNKLDMANQVLENTCLNTNQVKEILQVFAFEKTKLDFAKTAYNRTTDKNRYFTLNDAFSFSSSVTELNNHIRKK